MHSLMYTPPATNVFKATIGDRAYLWTLLEPDQWYYANVTWDEFVGPFHSEQEAQINFDLYLKTVRSCPSCEE